MPHVMNSDTTDRRCVSIPTATQGRGGHSQLCLSLSRHTIGNRWPDAKVADNLDQMRASLIDPYWAVVELRDTLDQVRMSNSDHRRCAAVADDGKGMVPLFDPVEESFVLA